VQSRIPDPGLPLTSPDLRDLLKALLPAGVYAGFDVAVTAAEELTVSPGDALMQDGILYREDAPAILNFTTPPIPTLFTVAALHDETGLLGGSAVHLEILAGKQETISNGIPLAFVDHPGVVPLAQSMITQVTKLRLPNLIADLGALRPIDLVAPFTDRTVNAAVQGQATLPGADANGGITITAVTPGPTSVTYQHVVAGLNTVLNVVVVGPVVTVNLGTNASGAAISTANQVVAALLASIPASALVFPKAKGTGAGKAAASAVTPLTGGLLAAGPSTTTSFRYDRVAGLTFLRISVGGPGTESFVLVANLLATSRPPRKILVVSRNPAGSSLSFILRGTDGVDVVLTPASIGVTAGWITSEILVAPGVFSPGEDYIFQVQATVPAGFSLDLARITIDPDPFSLVV
jgi:hypothetical protein